GGWAAWREPAGTGGPASDRLYGQPVFAYLAEHPEAVGLRTYLAGAADYLGLVAAQAEAMEIAPGRRSTRRTPTGSCSWRTASTATTCCRCTPPTLSTWRRSRAAGRTSAVSTRPSIS